MEKKCKTKKNMNMKMYCTIYEVQTYVINNQ